MSNSTHRRARGTPPNGLKIRGSAIRFRLWAQRVGKEIADAVEAGRIRSIAGARRIAEAAVRS